MSAQGLQQLAVQLPEHPYSRLGADAVLEYASQTEALLAACGANMQGEARRPHLRVTPLGTLRTGVAVAARGCRWRPCASAARLHGGDQRFCRFSAASGRRRPRTAAEWTAAAAEIDLPLLDVLRDNPTEFRAANIARVLDDENLWPALQCRAAAAGASSTSC